MVLYVCFGSFGFVCLVWTDHFKSIKKFGKHFGKSWTIFDGKGGNERVTLWLSKLDCPLLPNTVEDGAIREYPDIKVWLKYLVERPYFLIPKESVRHPHFGGVSHCEVPDSI